MLRAVGLVVAVCLSASSVARADTSAEQKRTSEDIAFTALVEKADRARLAGRTVEAAMAYEAALKRHQDPVLLGRYGLVLMKLGHLAAAAQALLAAFEHGQGVSAQERREVSIAYDKAKASTTWVNIAISQMGATIVYDGSPLSRESQSSFWMFAMPGEHTLRAKLDGYQDAEATFTAKAGEEMTVTLKLVPNPEIALLDQTERTLETLLRKKRRFPPPLLGSNVVGEPNYEAKEDPYHGEPKETKPVPKKSGPRFSVTGGVVTVFGVASWNPAVGAVIGVGLRPNDYVSLGLEGRAAWLTTPVADREAIGAMTAGGLLNACGHLKWFFGCGLGYVGTVNVSASKVTYQEKTQSFVQPGFGARLGAEIPMGSSFVARVSVDALRLYYRVQIGVGGVVIVDQPPVMLGGQLTGEWKL